MIPQQENSSVQRHEANLKADRNFKKIFLYLCDITHNPVPKYSPNITLSFAIVGQPLTPEQEALEYIVQQCLSWFPFGAQKAGKMIFVRLLELKVLFSTLTTSFAVS